jgi:ABC-type polysaccharide/polyol phosphate transport system ATPase subunit
LVSHSVEQVRAISDRACVLKKGRLVLEGTVEETIQAFSTMLRDDKREAARCS